MATVVRSMTSDEIYDICIIGAGLTGSAAARWTSSLQKNAKVCLIGPNEPMEHEWNDPSRTIFGAHYDQGRIVSEVTTSQSTMHDSWMILANRSIRSYKEIEKESGINFFNEVGNVFISSERTVDELLNKCPKILKRYVSNDLSSAISSFKTLDDEMAAIFESSHAGYINPRAYIAANKLLASKNGCEMIEDVVTEIRDNTDNGGKVGEREELHRRHQVIRTKSGCVIRASRVLLCPGAFANTEHILPNGVEIDISTTTETCVLVEVQDKDVERLSSLPCFGLKMKDRRDRRNSYCMPAMKYPDGKYYMKVGHGLDLNRPLVSNDDVTAWYKQQGNISDSSQDLDSLVSRLFTCLKDFQPKSLGVIRCVITSTPTGRFYCDMVTPNLGVIVGGNGLGATVADEVGKMGALMIAKGSWDHDLPPELFQLRYK
ncbi:uncharacterized protein LOC121415547 [Lytechinus variegatus]|uniref:uncharacterized protein LOC121415547 n=1 Tax=Lytechinus variegatus TaxID=7654 RepID=UPI001BB0F44E|nr:uncharacterized protein LOC121415547 [Lytechinus variegatus]